METQCNLESGAMSNTKDLTEKLNALDEEIKTVKEAEILQLRASTIPGSKASMLNELEAARERVKSGNIRSVFIVTMDDDGIVEENFSFGRGALYGMLHAIERMRLKLVMQTLGPIPELKYHVFEDEEE